ncbi:MAG TPA: DUF1569 domain-containing protein [Flavobacterium sp.]|jgi:hypothetical protein
MVNIFNIEDNKNIVGRIERLGPESQPLWGKMNVSQMVTHCQKPLDVAEGRLILKQGLIGLLFGKMAKRDFLTRPEFKKNLPTAPSFKIVSTPEFEAERERLLNQIVRFRETGPAVISNKKHPFFGIMTDEEWGILHYKHLDHHLKQFGV